jgi:hypothetical protein
MAARRTRTKVTTGAGIPDTKTAGTPESAKDEHGLAVFRQKLARGGKAIEGKEPRKRFDRGGKVRGKGKMTVNVIVGGQSPAGGGAAAVAPPPAMPSPMMPPPRPPMAPPPPAMAPGAPSPPMGRAKGGRLPAYPLDAGGGGGEGRLEKAKAYGKKALEGAKA